VLEKYGMSNCATLSTPADPCIKLTPQMSPQIEEEKQEMKSVPFRSASARSRILIS
jgi:hypothetical protein